MLVENDGLGMTVSGDPDELTYDFKADRYAIKIDSLEGDAAITMFNMFGSYSVMQDTLSRIGYDFTIGTIDIDVLFREAGGEGVVKGNADMTDLIMSAKMATPQDMDMTADQPPFVDGLAFEGGYSFGDLRYAFDFNADGEAASGTATSEGGQLAFSFDVDGASYVGETRGIDVSLLIPSEFPFPIEATMAQYGFDFRVPLSQGDDGPRDARMAFNFTELAISEMLWGLFDQGAVLPRDPITVAVGIDAQVTPFFDFLDPAQQEAAMISDIPGELNSATITDLTIKGAGAEITGDGAFTFDNSDLETFDGLPRPTGQVNFAINGANALIDNLIAMGLIPQGQAMMPRMMMGMFTTPVGDDMLTSTSEINNEGHVLANGQCLR
jgi:hypothetical protein